MPTHPIDRPTVSSRVPPGLKTGHNDTPRHTVNRSQNSRSPGCPPGPSAIRHPDTGVPLGGRHGKWRLKEPKCYGKHHWFHTIITEAQELVLNQLAFLLTSCASKGIGSKSDYDSKERHPDMPTHPIDRFTVWWRVPPGLKTGHNDTPRHSETGPKTADLPGAPPSPSAIGHPDAGVHPSLSSAFQKWSGIRSGITVILELATWWTRNYSYLNKCRMTQRSKIETSYLKRSGGDTQQ